jgi:hypothetical protein
MTRVEILDAAARAVNGDRDKKHGRPEDSFAMIGQLWEAYTGRHYSPVDVAMMLALLKIARIRTGTGEADSFVDLAGYAACAGELDSKTCGWFSNRNAEEE